MSSKNNANPDHYKTAGRARPGQDIEQEIQKQKFTEAQASEEAREHRTGSEFIPGDARKAVLPSATESDSEHLGDRRS